MASKEKFIKELAAAFQGFIVYDELIPELTKLIHKTGESKRFTNMLIKRLDFLSEYREFAHLHHEEFEQIDEILHSMHLSSNSFNIRILYAFNDDGTVLLLAFYERGGKSATDYTHKIPEAMQRLRNMEE